ncbi:MAG TPA: GAF domain-containing protein [Bacillales bacterium]|nr:GAF domain-containing protein [Bacillales bacterium]
MKLSKRDILVKRIENHLRLTSRQLVKFDTEEETLQYLINSFRSELHCDFVGIFLKEEHQLFPKAISGGSESFVHSFPLNIIDCSNELLTKSLTIENTHIQDCQFSKLLMTEKITTWFTLPLKEANNISGFCVIGFMSAVPLFIEMDDTFNEFSKDVAVAISLAKGKEKQKEKMIGIEWFSQNLLLDSTIEQLVERIVERAAKGTKATGACIYLFDEKEDCFVLQSPAYGVVKQPEIMAIADDYVLKHHFPCLEVPGGGQLTVPLVINLKTIGVLHVEDKRKGVFTNDDIEVLELMSTHVASMLENARLYKNEKEHKQKLHSLLDYHQELIKKTVEQEGFEGITGALSKLLLKSVLLFDRFMRPLAYSLLHLKETDLRIISKFAEKKVMNNRKYELVIPINDNRSENFHFWPVNGAGDLLGYLAVNIPSEEFDELERISIELALNVYSVQFVKQKLVLDTKEQVKDSFINKLLAKKVEDPNSIMQYANLFNWDLRKEYRISVLSIILNDDEIKKGNLLEQQAKKSFVWERLRASLQLFDPDFIFSNKGDDFILFVEAEKEWKNPEKYWDTLYEYLNNRMKMEKMSGQLYIGVGGKTSDIHEYYNCYQQGIQAINVINQRIPRQGFALFEKLGAYTLLYHLRNNDFASDFINRHLKPLLQHSDQKNVDLFQTLRVYLFQNGNLKETADTLFIHRSTLQYRIEKIQSLLKVDINDSEERLNLMMAYKLYDLQRVSPNH